MKRNPVIKMGIGGFGEDVEESILVLKRLKRFQLSGIYCRKPETGAHWANLYNLKSFSSMEEMLDEVEGVVLVGGGDEQADLYAKIIKRAKHLFVVAGQVQSVPAGSYLLDLIEEAGVVAQVHLKERFSSLISAIVPFIHYPLIIESRQHLPFLDAAAIESRLFERLQLLLSIVKANIRKYWGDGMYMPLTDCRTLNVKLQFDSDCVANMTAETIPGEASDRIKFIHKDMIVSLDLLHNSVEIQSMLNPIELELPLPKEPLFQFHKREVEKVRVAKRDFQAEPDILILEREMKAFYQSIVEGETVEIDLHNVLETVKIVKSIHHK